MNSRVTALFIILALAIFPVLSIQASAIDLDGDSSKVTVRSCITIDSDGLMKLNFKVFWGESEFQDSNIFLPKAVPPILPWTDLAWENLSTMITPISTIQYLFDSPLPNGKTLVASEKHFVETVLDIDVPFTIRSIEPRILSEFQTIEIQARLEPSENSYTLSPLKFLPSIDFHEYPPHAEVEVNTGPSIVLQSNSFALNHFLLPEGHRFQSEGLFSIEDSRITYDTAEDSIHVRKLPAVISSTLLYSIWIGAAFLSMIILAVASRRAKVRVSKGGEMWFAIGMVCFFAFLPYHLFLSLILIVMGFYYSFQKSRSLKPEKKPASAAEDDPSSVPDETPTSTPPPEKVIGEPRNSERIPLQPLRSEEIKGLIPPPLALQESSKTNGNEDFAPPTDPSGEEKSETKPNDPSENIESSFSRPTFQDEVEKGSDEKIGQDSIQE